MAPAGSTNGGRPTSEPNYSDPLVRHTVKQFEAFPAPSGDCIGRIAVAAGMGLGFGAFYNLVAVPWQPDPVEHLPKGAIKFRDNWKFFRGGFVRPMALFSVIGMTFSGVECLMEGVRDPESKSRHWNTAAGGFASGMVMGATTKRLDIALVAGAATGIFMGCVAYNGMSYTSDPYQMAMKVGGKWPVQYRESSELAALKEKYPDYKDL